MSRAGFYLVNVGVNSSHPARSPRFSDGRFEFVPIPERTRDLKSRRWRRYRDLPASSIDGLARWPASWSARAAHDDPDFDVAVYGDMGHSGRSAGLRSVVKGDRLLFVARLVDLDGEGGWGDAGFYLIGHLDIAEVLWDCRGPESLTGPFRQRLATHAHVRRAAAVHMWDGFNLFIGAPSSRLYSRAARLDRALADRALCRADGGPWRWRRDRSELWTIGVYTRAARLIARQGEVGAQDARIRALANAVEGVAPGEWGL